MVNPFRRWFGGSRSGADWSSVSAWAQANGQRFSRSSDGSGFIVEADRVGASWRLEWGTSQRHYFNGPELRLRAEVGPTGGLQMLVISRELMVRLEQQVFEESTDGTETCMDDSLPEEMRWLVLYPKVPRALLGDLREHFGALSNLPSAAPSWLDAPLAKQLNAVPAWLPAPMPLLMVVQRGRLTLRCNLTAPALPALRAAIDLFGAALAAARRVGDEVAQGRIGGERPSLWGPPSAMPPVDPAPR